MAKRAPVAKKAPPKPKPKTLHTKPVPACKKWTRAAAYAGKKKATGKFRSMCRSGPVIASIKPDYLYLHAILSFVEVVDIAESSLSQEEVDKENQRLLESLPAAEVGEKQEKRLKNRHPHQGVTQPLTLLQL